MAWNATVLNLAGPRAFRCPFPSRSLRRGHALKAACRELSRLLMRKDAWEVRPIGNDELRRSCLDLTRTIPVRLSDALGLAAEVRRSIIQTEVYPWPRVSSMGAFRSNLPKK